MKTFCFLFISASFVLFLIVHSSAAKHRVRNFPSKKYPSTHASILVDNEEFTIEPAAKHKIEPDSHYFYKTARLSSSSNSELPSKNPNSFKSSAENDHNGMSSQKNLSSNQAAKSNQEKSKVPRKSQSSAAAKPRNNMKVSKQHDTKKVDKGKNNLKHRLPHKTRAKRNNNTIIGHQKNLSKLPMIKTSTIISNSTNISNHKNKFKSTVQPLKSDRTTKKLYENKPTKVNPNKSTKTIEKSKQKSHAGNKQVSKPTVNKKYAKQFDHKLKFRNIHKNLLGRSILRQLVTHGKKHQGRGPHNLAMTDTRHHIRAGYAGSRKFQKKRFLDQKYDMANMDGKGASESLMSFQLPTSTAKSIFSQPLKMNQFEQPHWNEGPEAGFYPEKEGKSPAIDVTQNGSLWPKPLTEAPQLQLPPVQPSNDFNNIKMIPPMPNMIENFFEEPFGAVKSDIQLVNNSNFVGLPTLPAIPANPLDIMEGNIQSDQFHARRKEDPLPPSELKQESSTTGHQGHQLAFAQDERESLQPVAEIGIFQKQSTVPPVDNRQSKWNSPRQNDQNTQETKSRLQSQQVPPQSERGQNPFAKKSDNQLSADHSFSVDAKSGSEQAPKEMSHISHQSEEFSWKNDKIQNEPEAPKNDWNVGQQNLPVPRKFQPVSETAQKTFEEDSGHNQRSSQQISPTSLSSGAEWETQQKPSLQGLDSQAFSQVTAPVQNAQESQRKDLNLQEQLKGVPPQNQPSEQVQNTFYRESDKSGELHPSGKSDAVSETSLLEPSGRGRLDNSVSPKNMLPQAGQIVNQRQNSEASRGNQMLSIMSNNLSSVKAVIANQEKPQNAAWPKSEQELIEEQLRISEQQNSQFMQKNPFSKTEQEILEQSLSADQPPETDEIEVKFGVTCDNADSQICWMEREVGDVVTLSIEIDSPYRRNSFQVRWIKMYHVLDEKAARPLELQPGMLPWNMVSGSDNRELRLNPVTNSDLDPNSFVAKVFQLVKQKGRTLYKELKSLTFHIEIPLIDMGKVYAGEELSINIENFISLPERGNMILDWRLETKPHQLEYLPSNAKVSKSGRLVVLKELKKGRLGILTCTIYSSSKFAVAKRRFNFLDIADRDKRQVKHELIAEQAKELKRSQRCRRLIRRSQQKLIQKLRSSSHHLSRSKRYKRSTMNRNLRSLYKECEPWRKEMYSRWIRSLFSDASGEATTETHPHPMPLEQLIELSDEGDGTLDDVIPREVHYVKPQVKVLKGTYVETRAAGVKKTSCLSDAECSQNATCQLNKTNKLGKSGYCVCLPKFYGDGGTCRKIPEFNHREKRLKRHLEAKQRDLSLEPRLFYANRRVQTRVMTDPPPVEEVTETTPKVLAFEEEESFLLTDCTDDKDCSSHASCTQSPNGHPYCKCRPGFRGNGIFCWEIMDYVPLEEQVAPAENPPSEAPSREQTTLPDSSIEGFGSKMFPAEEIDEE